METQLPRPHQADPPESSNPFPRVCALPSPRIAHEDQKLTRCSILVARDVVHFGIGAQLMFRAEQQKLLTTTVQSNTAMRKAEHAQSKQRRTEMDAERMAEIAEENEKERARFLEKKASVAAKIKSRHNKIHKQYLDRHQGQYERIEGDFKADTQFVHAPGESSMAKLGGQRGRDGAGAAVSGMTNFASHIQGEKIV